MPAIERQLPTAGRSPRRDPLVALFAPRSVAVIGASEAPGSVGRSVLENLTLFAGPVHAVNPNHKTIFGRCSFSSVLDISEPPDLAVIATPAATVPQIVRSCVEAKIPAAVILSAGFKECGAKGAELEKQILAEARKGGLRLVGPNCLGVMTPALNLNATFANRIANPGSVAFLSQSGALCAAILDWSFKEDIGFSSFVSVGSMIDIGWGDLINHFGDDPHTKSILCYMESVGDARSFMSAAREVALTKPIIILKVGHTDAGARAAASHTGALTGSDAVLDAAFRRAGVLRVQTLDELFDMAEVLAKQPRLHGPRLAIVTNAGGPGALAADMLISSGAALARLSPNTLQSLNMFLPDHWSHTNPVDILGDAGPARFKQTILTVAADAEADGILTILTPQAVTDPTGTAVDVCECAKAIQKPLLASWMGGTSVEDAEATLNAAHIPTFKTPDAAARAFALMWQYSDNLRALYETPSCSPAAVDNGSAQAKAAEIISRARAEKRTLLTEIESGKVLRAYGIPVVESRLARDEEQSVAAADVLGYPVAVKLHSKSLTHKSDVGGVQLDITDAQGVRNAWRTIRRNVAPEHFDGATVQPMIRKSGIELILGSSTDPQFGPTLIFGTGGKLVEIYKDTVIGLPPLNSTLARRLIERTRAFAVLKGVRGEAPIDIAALEQIIVQFSQLVIDHPAIAEMDINPLLAAHDRILALDARLVLHPHNLQPTELPPPAIRPYPTQYVSACKLKDGTPIIIRPVRPDDEPLMVQFHQTLSDRSVYLRYFSPLKLDQRVAHTRLSRLCFIDYDREMGLVAEHTTQQRHRHIVGIARLSRVRHAREAEFSLLVSDEWQGAGLGTELLRRLVHIGRDAALARITGVIMPENVAMQRVASNVGFTLRHSEGECFAELAL